MKGMKDRKGVDGSGKSEENSEMVGLRTWGLPHEVVTCHDCPAWWKPISRRLP